MKAGDIKLRVIFKKVIEIIKLFGVSENYTGEKEYQ